MKVPWFPAGLFGRPPVVSSDQDELRLALVADYKQRLVRLEFGGPVTWVGLPVHDARALAQLLVELADSVERGQGSQHEEPHG